MPLLDHFRGPLSEERDARSFLGRWAVALADSLNPYLPEKWYHTGPLITTALRRETQIAAFEHEPQPPEEGGPVRPWVPPSSVLTLPTVFPESLEAQVIKHDGGAYITGVVLVVSERNRSSPAQRRAIAAKCVTYLQQGVGVILIDIVTNHRGNLHQEILDLLGHDHAFGPPADSDLYAVAYRPAQRGEQSQLDIWPATLALGQALPTLPLALRGAFFVPVDLEATYMEARRHCRL